MGKGYDTDCREYDPKQYNKNDCTFDCYQERAKYFCKTINFVSFPMLKKKIYFEQSNLNFIKFYIKAQIRYGILEFCYEQCHKECQITYYRIIPLVPAGIRRDVRVFLALRELHGTGIKREIFEKSNIIFIEF